jgi:tripartite-type tricarboxylate transporter receptor subunit TctC
MKHLALGSLALALAASPHFLGAQDYPAKPLTVIIPNAAGGSSEILGRILAPKLTSILKQPVIILARPGGNGIIGMDATAKAAPDGYTMVLGNTQQFVRIYIDGNVKPPFTARDFLPVTMIGETPLVITAYPGFPPRTMKELIDYSRANPGKVSFGAQSSRSFEMDMIRFDQKLDMISVPYAGGSGEIVRDLIGGHIHLTAATTSSVISQIRSGAFRAIALMSDRRDPTMPDVPTVVEAGFPAYQSTLWFGIALPAATPRPVADRLHGAFAAALADEEIKKQFLNRAVLVRTSTPAEFGEFITTELARWRKVAETIEVKR